MEIIMIRHFCTPGNLEKRYIGRTDEPLAANEKPISAQVILPQAEKVITSSMKRCVQTAAVLFPGQMAMLCEKMRECDFGIFEGKNYEELKDDPIYQKWLDSCGTMPIPEGESHDSFVKRCVEGFTETVDTLIQQQVENAAMVVHGGTIMAVLDRFGEQKFRGFYDWQVANGEGFRFQIQEDEWRRGIRVCRKIERWKMQGTESGVH